MNKIDILILPQTQTTNDTDPGTSSSYGSEALSDYAIELSNY